MPYDQENYWREQGRLIAHSELRTDLFLELVECLSEREQEDSSETSSWMADVSCRLQAALEASVGTDSSADSQVTLSELFFSEGVELWLEALDLLESGAESEAVLECAERGQRMLKLVQIMAE